MTRPTWNETWMETARSIAKRSLCSSRKIGAVIVKQGVPVSVGYNGPSSSFCHGDQECIEWCARQKKRSSETTDAYGLDCPAIHAEANALLRANRNDLDGSSLFVTAMPCPDCAKLISNSGVESLHISLNKDKMTDSEERTAIFLFQNISFVEVIF